MEIVFSWPLSARVTVGISSRFYSWLEVVFFWLVNILSKGLQSARQKRERLKQRTIDMVPDLQDSAFHAGVIVALVICFILDVCPRSAGPQVSEFYSVLILFGFSTIISLISVPSFHKAVRFSWMLLSMKKVAIRWSQIQELNLQL